MRAHSIDISFLLRISGDWPFLQHWFQAVSWLCRDVFCRQSPD
jgi:hypothetical protein